MIKALLLTLGIMVIGILTLFMFCSWKMSKIADEINLDEVNDILCGKLANTACKSVYCVEYDRYFPSITQVEKELGVPRTRVYYALKHSGIVHLDNGSILHFEYTKQ